MDNKKRLDRGLMLLVLAATLVLSGCGTSALPPPVTITFRNSVFSSQSKVIQIANNSSHHFYNVRVVGRNFQDVSSASVRAAEELRPGQTVEVGWLEFGNWTPRSGESIEVYCDDYVTPQIKIIPQ